MEPQYKRLIFLGAGLVIGLILFLIVNPFSWNDAGNRTVVEQSGGHQFVEFRPGIFYSGFFAKETEWPNQISVTYQDSIPDLELKDNGIEVGRIKIMFSDGTIAYMNGIVQFVMPSSEREMILIHNTHRSPQSLVSKRLAPYTIEALQSSAQVMTSDKHYGGGRAQMSQDFLDQLRNGVYISKVTERVFYDSVEHEKRRLYLVEVQLDKNGIARRKPSSIKEYEITVADASIINTQYEQKVMNKLSKIIEASTKSAISRQELMTAQQQTLTAKAEGEKALVEIEYKQKQEQTREVVAAETEVKVAEQDKAKQKIAYEAAIFEAQKRKTIADVAAYEKRTIIQADGALSQKLAAIQAIHASWANAFGQYTGNIVPYISTTGGNGNGAVNFMDFLSVKMAKDLNSDLKVK